MSDDEYSEIEGRLWAAFIQSPWSLERPDAMRPCAEIAVDEETHRKLKEYMKKNRTSDPVTGGLYYLGWPLVGDPALARGAVVMRPRDRSPYLTCPRAGCSVS